MIEGVAEAVLWVSTGLIGLTYFAYPGALWLLVRSTPSHTAWPSDWPTVTMIVAAYNEALVIADKITNALELDYPRDRLQVIIVSAGSTDETADMAESHARGPIRCVRIDERVAKTTAQNRALSGVASEVIVFSDANSMYSADALKHLVSAFSDPTVGCACGELRYVNPAGSGAGEGEGLYWRYEQFIKRRESALGSLVGANGAIYAVRRELFEELGPDVIPDLILPVRVRRRGFRVVYVPEAIAVESTGKGFRAEYDRRVRITARSLHGLITEAGVLNPLHDWLFALQFWIHKVLRWLVPVFMLLALAALLVLCSGGRYQLVAGLGLGGVALAVLGLVLPHTSARSKVLYVPAYLMAMNAGVLVGVIRYLASGRVVLWQPPERVRTSAE